MRIFKKLADNEPVSCSAVVFKSSELTNKINKNVDPMLRQSVNQLPIEQWLRR
jgi:hypothetical protein